METFKAKLASTVRVTDVARAPSLIALFLFMAGSFYRNTGPFSLRLDNLRVDDESKRRYRSAQSTTQRPVGMVSNHQ